MKSDTTEMGLETIICTALTGTPNHTPMEGYWYDEENVLVEVGAMEVDE